MKPVIIGVAGGSGSGKTTVVREIVQELGPDDVAVIQHDSYYCDRSDIPLDERVGLNYDHPDALETSLLVEHARQLQNGNPVRIPVYDFSTHTRTADTILVTSTKVVILEGILVLADTDLRNLMDIKVFVDTDSDIRMIRRLERDVRERGRSMNSVIKQYLDTVRPMHLEFVEPSKRYAHVIIPEGGQNTVAVDMLITKIRAIVQSH